MKIEIIDTKRLGFVVTVDGETLLECLGEQEVKQLTIGEIMELATEGMET